MSRAFVKEDGPDLAPLPDLPVSTHPNWVTARGLALLQDRLAQTQARLGALRDRADWLDRAPEAAAERDIRYLETRLASARLVEPDAACAAVAFGHAVRVADADGAETVWTIVGEDEADAARHRVAPHSPLARALIGARVGDTVVWRRPAGAVELDVLAIAVP